eukprot:698875-Rhodomonas_salina.2
MLLRDVWYWDSIWCYATCAVLRSCIVLCGVRGTEIWYGAMRYAILRYVMALRDMCGTELAYDAMRYAILRKGMVLPALKSMVALVSKVQTLDPRP